MSNRQRRWHLHHHLLQSMLLLALYNDAGTSERLLQARDYFVFQSEESNAIVAKHAQLLGDISQSRWMEHIGVLKIEFSCLSGKK